MPDLLTHVLLAYSASVLLGLALTWIGQPEITATMVGAILPDVAKINLVVPSWQVQSMLSLPFSWTALHTAGGVVLSIGIGLVLVSPRHRARVGCLLALGAGSHLVADSFLRSVAERPFPILWPFTMYAPPTPDVYLSTDVWPTGVAITIACLVTVLARYLRGRSDEFPTNGTQ